MIGITARLPHVAMTTGNRKLGTYYLAPSLLLTSNYDFLVTESGDRLQLEQLIPTKLVGIGYMFTESGDRLIAENNDLLNLE